MIQNFTGFDLESLVAGLKLDKSPFRSAAPLANTNLVCSNQNHIFVFIEQIGAFLTIHLATSKQAPQTSADSSVQYLNLNSPPVGRLKKCLVSSDGTYIMIVCDKSVTVMELPSKWGKQDRYEGGKSSVICKSTRLNVSKNLDIVDALWHPSSRESNIVLCLTSDNYLRFFKIGVLSGTSGATQFKEFHLDKTYTQTNLASKTFRILGIEIGAKLRYCDKFGYPIFALKSNGQVECVMEFDQSSKFEYLGPLDLAPYCMDVEEDNQVKGFICLRGAPNCLAILLTSGIVYHCLFMTNLKEAIRFYESENNFKEYYGQETGEANLNSGEALLYVYESVRLEENEPIGSNFQFLRDAQNNWRYFLCHPNGAHSISLPWFENLQWVYEKEESLNEFDESKLCEISQLITTRPFLNRNSNVFLIGSSLFFNYPASEQVLICLTNEPKLIDINITTRTNVDHENENDEFVNYIVSLMKRDASMPCIKYASGLDPIDSSKDSDETRRLMNNAINLIKSEYIEKQRLVIVEFKKKSKQLKQQENLQFELIKELDAKLDEIKSKRERILSSVEKLYQDEQRLKKRMENILNQLFMRSAIPKSEAENEMHTDLRAIDRNLKESINKIIESQRVLSENQGGGASQAASSVASSNVEESDTKLIKTLLKNQSDKIKTLIQKVETLSQSIKSAV